MILTVSVMCVIALEEIYEACVFDVSCEWYGWIWWSCMMSRCFIGGRRRRRRRRRRSKIFVGAKVMPNKPSARIEIPTSEITSSYALKDHWSFPFLESTE